MGISLFTQNDNKRDFYYDIAHISKALSQYSDLDEVEYRLTQMLSDKSLDYNNRIIAYFLFDRYIGCLKEEDRRAAATVKLEKAANTLPKFLIKHIKGQ